MARRGGWRRVGRRRPFGYVDAGGKRITDDAQLERIERLAIPPAWTDVWVSPSASARLQATGVDAAGRRQYGITTLTKRHVSVRGRRVVFRFRAKHQVLVRTTLVDDELAEAVRALLRTTAARACCGSTATACRPTSPLQG